MNFPEPDAAQSQWFQRFLLLLGGVFVLRLCVALSAPIDLAGDEAYYWEWGRQLDWGYFSKPPLIGWLMGLAGAISGNAEWGIRILPVLFGMGTLTVLYNLGARLWSAQVGFWVVFAVAMSPGNAASQLLFTIDSPLLFSWSLALFASVWLLQQPKSPTVPALLLGFALALGYLSKQMMLVFPLLLVGFIAFEKEYRFWLKRPVLWAILLISLIALLPPLWWNSQNDWITFAHTGGHFGSSSVSFGKRMGRFFEFIGSQMSLIGPILYPLMIAVLFMVLRRYRSLSVQARFLTFFSAPGIIIFFLLALKQRALPNWPAVFYLALSVLVVAWFVGAGSLASFLKPWRRWFRPGIFAGAILMLIMYVLAYVSPMIPLDRDVFERIRGWEAYGETVGKIDREQWAERGDIESKRFIYVVGHRYYAAELAFYHPEQPQVFLYNPPGRILSQYGLWAGPESTGASEALIVMTDDYESLPDEVLSRFEEIIPLGEIETPVTERVSRKFRLSIGKGFH